VSLAPRCRRSSSTISGGKAPDRIATAATCCCVSAVARCLDETRSHEACKRGSSSCQPRSPPSEVLDITEYLVGLRRLQVRAKIIRPTSNVGNDLGWEILSFDLQLRDAGLKRGADCLHLFTGLGRTLIELRANLTDGLAAKLVCLGRDLLLRVGKDVLSPSLSPL
jgi:hypothetical protein